jgi:hypothetical protein
VMLCVCDGDDDYKDKYEDGENLTWKQRQRPRPRRFTPLEELAVLLAALIHDVAHPGVSNVELTARRHALATAAERESCRSVAESFSAAIRRNLLGSVDFDFLGEAMSMDQRLELETLTTSLVLATDMATDDVTMPRARELMREPRESQRHHEQVCFSEQDFAEAPGPPEWERLTLLAAGLCRLNQIDP